HNTLQRGSLDSHGTESGGRFRGGRAFEVYNNSFTGSDAGQIVTYFRSGVGVIHDNTVSGYAASNTPFKLLNFRNEAMYSPFSTGNVENAGADGKNPWDVNLPGGPFGSGTAVSYTTGVQTSTVTVAGSPWTTDQWKG